MRSGSGRCSLRTIVRLRLGAREPEVDVRRRHPCRQVVGRHIHLEIARDTGRADKVGLGLAIGQRGQVERHPQAKVNRHRVGVGDHQVVGLARAIHGAMVVLVVRLVEATAAGEQQGIVGA